MGLVFAGGNQWGSGWGMSQLNVLQGTNLGQSSPLAAWLVAAYRVTEHLPQCSKPCCVRQDEHWADWPSAVCVLAGAEPLPGELWWSLLSSGHSGFLTPRLPQAASKERLRKLPYQNSSSHALLLPHIPGWLLVLSMEGRQHFTFLPGWKQRNLTTGPWAWHSALSCHVLLIHMGPAWCLLISSHAVPHPVCRHFLSSHVNRCVKVCASSITAVLSWWCGEMQASPRSPSVLKHQGTKQSLVPVLSELFAGRWDISAHTAISGALPFPTGASESFLPKSCCLSWQELSILLPTEQWVQHPLSLARSDL